MPPPGGSPKSESLMDKVENLPPVQAWNKLSPAGKVMVGVGTVGVVGGTVAADRAGWFSGPESAQAQEVSPFRSAAETLGYLEEDPVTHMPMLGEKPAVVIAAVMGPNGEQQMRVYTHNVTDTGQETPVDPNAPKEIFNPMDPSVIAVGGREFNTVQEAEKAIQDLEKSTTKVDRYDMVEINGTDYIYHGGDNPVFAKLDPNNAGNTIVIDRSGKPAEFVQLTTDMIAENLNMPNVEATVVTPENRQAVLEKNFPGAMPDGSVRFAVKFVNMIRIRTNPEGGFMIEPVITNMVDTSSVNDTLDRGAPKMSPDDNATYLVVTAGEGQQVTEAQLKQISQKLAEALD